MPSGALQWLVRRAATIQTPFNVQDAVLLVRAMKNLNVARSADGAVMTPEMVRAVCEKAAFTLAAEPHATQPPVIVDLINTLATLQAGALPVVKQVLTRRLLQLNARQTPRQTLQKAAVALIKLGHRHGSLAINDHLLRELHDALSRYPEDTALRLAYIGLYPYTTYATRHTTTTNAAFPALRTLWKCAQHLVASRGAPSRLSSLKGNTALQALHLYPILTTTFAECDTSTSSDGVAADASREAWRQLREAYIGQICITSISSHAFAQFLLDFLPTTAHDPAIFVELLGAFVQPGWHDSFNTFDVAKVATAVGNAIDALQSNAARLGKTHRSEDEEQRASTMQAGVELSFMETTEGDASALCVPHTASSNNSNSDEGGILGVAIVAVLRVCVNALDAFLAATDIEAAVTYTAHGATLATVWHLLQRCCRASQLGLLATHGVDVMLYEQLHRLLDVTQRALDIQRVALTNLEERLLTSNGMVWVVYSMTDIYCTVPRAHNDITSCLRTLLELVHNTTTPTTLTVRSRVQLLYALARLMRASTQMTSAPNAIRADGETRTVHADGTYYATVLEEWCTKELQSSEDTLCGRMSSEDACMLLRAVSHAVHAVVTRPLVSPTGPTSVTVLVMPASCVVLAIECVRARLPSLAQGAAADGTAWAMGAVVTLLSLQALPAYRVEAMTTLAELLPLVERRQAASPMTLEQCNAILRELQWLQSVATAVDADDDERCIDDVDDDELHDSQVWSTLREGLLRFVCDAFATATTRHLAMPLAQPGRQTSHVHWVDCALQCCDAGLQLDLPLILHDAPQQGIQRRGLALSVAAVLARPGRLRGTDAAHLLRLIATQVMHRGPQVMCSPQSITALRDCALGTSSSSGAKGVAPEADAVIYLLQANQHMLASTTLFDDAAIQRLLRLTTHHLQALSVDQFALRSDGPASRRAALLLRALLNGQVLPRCSLHSLRPVPALRDAVQRISQALSHLADPQHQVTVMTAQLLCDGVSVPNTAQHT